MQSPEAILVVAKSGNIPPTWRVLRPSRGYPVGAGFLGAFLTIFVLFFGLIASFIAGSVGVLGRQTEDTLSTGDPVTFLKSLLPIPSAVLLGGAISAVILVALLSVVRAVSRIPYSYFVFTPEGAVQATGPNAVKAIDYGAIDLINSRVQVNTTTYRNANTGAVTRSSSSVSVWGELHYLNGRTERFRPASRFGSPQSLIQRLINGLQEYKMLVRSPSGGYSVPKNAS